METVSSWRATYVPGNWVVLAGPTSVVVMQPAPARLSGLLGDLWQDVVSAADVADLAEKFSAFRLDLMPHFAAFFWAGDGMHSLIRGGLRAVDVETGEVVAEGEGFHTWNEVGLQSVRQVRVEMDPPGDEPALELPLAVGVVLASAVTIDSTQKVSLVLPTAAHPAAEAQTEPVAEGTSHEPTEEPPVAAPDARAGEAVAMLEPLVPVVGGLEAPAEGLPAEPTRHDDSAVVAPEEGSGDAPTDDVTTLVEEPSPADADQAEDSEGRDRSQVEESLDDSVVPDEPSWPAPPEEPQEDAWGVRDAQQLAPVDLFVDEDEDGVPDAQQSGLDLGAEEVDAHAETLALDLGAPEEPQGPPPGWNQRPESPYGQPQPGQYGPPSVPAPFAAPGLTSAPFAQPVPAPVFPRQPFPGQAYPGQPLPGQPFQGLAAPGQPTPQQPAYPETPYGGPLSGNAPLVSPVPPPAAYAPGARPQGLGEPSGPALPVSAGGAEPETSGEDVAMAPEPGDPQLGGEDLVLAVMCTYGHPNRPGSQRCRVCGQAVDNAAPRPVRKPVLAQLITSGGDRVDVTGSVLIGRAPSAHAGDEDPVLLPIPSPNSDISRTHLKVSVRDWDIVATDLHSTNGTMLVRPGLAPVRMMPGTPVTVEPGTILDLGDGGVITVGLPA